jgi:hypothetical protein
MCALGMVRPPRYSHSPFPSKMLPAIKALPMTLF